MDLLGGYQATAGAVTPLAIGAFAVLRYLDGRTIEKMKVASASATADAAVATAKADAAGKAADHTEKLIELAQSITKDTMEAQRAELQRSQELLKKSEERVEVLRHELDQAIITSSAQDAFVTRLKGEVTAREEDNARLRQHVSELQAEIRALRARVKQLEGEAANLKQIVETIRRRPETANLQASSEPVPTSPDDPVIPKAMRDRKD